jgi:hypothetical protein
MKTIEIDARRYAWSRCHSLWIIGMSVQTFLEDVHGAQAAGQDGLLRYAARMVGDTCAAALTLALNYERPIPSRAMRTSWALERLQGHELCQPCWELIRGLDDAPAEEIVERCDDLVAAVRAIAGEMPNILTPEGYYPGIAIARDWLKLLEAVGEESPMPPAWTQPT